MGLITLAWVALLKFSSEKSTTGLIAGKLKVVS